MRDRLAGFSISTLKSRADFVRARNGARAHSAHFVVQLRPASNARPDAAAHLRVGYTVTKKVGNAVTRNRIKRRLREAVRAGASDLEELCVASPLPMPLDAVLIARQGAATAEFSDLTKEVVRRVKEAARRAAEPKKPGKTGSRRRGEAAEGSGRRNR